MNKQTKEWSRARLCKPKDNLTTEAGKRERFVPSCELESGIDVALDWLGIRSNLAARSRQICAATRTGCQSQIYQE
ncbi:uncharacterized protein LOC120446409 isoform X2 [Drosophila santomea]|uniref:uncharacterized protein LOC120446409 isoform X2 n=1 Tax=Drosophila santomea TaxID=129105 RepID=UPI0019541D52|nr:uncharacterized protein LOC120446409 isoform X2 [Drosophila santomea]